MEKLNFLIGSYIGTVRAMFSVRLWTPFLLFAILSFIVLWLFAHPYFPVLGSVFSTLAHWITGSEGVAHYPDLYAYLPNTWGMSIIVLSVIMEVALVGSGFLLLAGYYRREKTSFSVALSGAMSRYFAIFLIWLSLTLVFMAILLYVPKLFDPLVGGSPRRTLALKVGLHFTIIPLIQALLMYALPNILIDGQKLMAAVGSSMRTFLRNIVSSYVIALIPGAIALPFMLAVSRPDMIVTKFYPELVLYLIVGQIVTNMIASFVFASTVIRFNWEFAE